VTGTWPTPGKRARTALEVCTMGMFGLEPMLALPKVGKPATIGCRLV
jgi:hypothetical protein